MADPESANGISTPVADQQSAFPLVGSDGEAAPVRRRTRSPRPFPASSFLEALPLAEAIQKFAPSGRVRRLTLFEKLERSVESGASKQLVTNSAQYGLTKGSYVAEYLELTPTGALASGEDTLGSRRLAARLELAIEQIPPFKALYEQNKNNRIPSTAVLRDSAIENGVAPDRADECVETFLANARDLGLLRNMAGAERLLTFEMVLEETGLGSGATTTTVTGGLEGTIVPSARATHVPSVPSTPAMVLGETRDVANICFVISPIGDEDSEQRRHSDLVLGFTPR